MRSARRQLVHRVFYMIERAVFVAWRRRAFYCVPGALNGQRFQALLKVFDERFGLVGPFALGGDDVFRRLGRKHFVIELGERFLQIVPGLLKLFSMRSRSFSRSTSSASGIYSFRFIRNDRDQAVRRVGRRISDRQLAGQSQLRQVDAPASNTSVLSVAIYRCGLLAGGTFISERARADGADGFHNTLEVRLILGKASPSEYSG